jgi:Cu2+-exporting ATPase
VVTEASVVVEVGADARSSVDRIANLVWNRQSDTTGVQKLADRLAVVFVPTVVALAALVGVGSFVTGAGPTAALLTALTVLVVVCPCALGLATPLAVAAGIREAMRRTVVVFDDSAFERLRDAETVVFDKTGTLTTGEMAVVDDDPAALKTVFDLATATRSRVRQNVGWAFVYNGVAIPLAVGGLLNPLFAAAAMATSSLLVVANSGRPLLRSDRWGFAGRATNRVYDRQ